MSKSGKYRFLNPEALAGLGRLNLVARQVVEGFITGLHRSPFRGFSVEFSEHREYVPGDDTRDLDWQALARTDRYFIKQYEEETNLRCHLLLDASGSMAYRGPGASATKFEYACCLAASLAFLMNRQRDPVGLVEFSENITNFLPPRASTLHLNRLLQRMEAAKPEGRTDLGAAFHSLAERIRRRGLIIVISDLYDDDPTGRSIVRGLRHFRHRKHEVLVFHVLDQAELEFPFDRLSEFQDMETGERVQADPAYVAEEYRRGMQGFVESCRRECSAARIDYVQANTATPYDVLLRAYLAKRKRLG